MLKQVTLKIGNMRKPQNFVVYPPSGSSGLKIQSDDCIAVVDPNTGECVWVRHKGGAYFIHLQMPTLANIGHGKMTLTPGELQQIKDAQSHKGDRIGAGVSIG